METQRVNYGAWLLRLLTWDGLLPAFVIFTPAVAKQIMPGRHQAIEFISCILPIAAFILRLFIARRHIYSNHCTDQMRDRQFVFLVYAAGALLTIDTNLILAHDLPAGAMFGNTFDAILWTGVFTIYFACMAVAMYPGRTEDTADYAPFDSFADKALDAKWRLQEAVTTESAPPSHVSEARAVEFRPLTIVDCRWCGTTVAPTPQNECPACRRSLSR